MDVIEPWLKLGNQSWPLVTLVLLGLVAWKFTYWLKPHFEKLGDRAVMFLEEGIKSNAANSTAIREQTAVLFSMDGKVGEIKHSQDDTQVSAVATLAKLDRSLLNDKSIARAGIEAMEVVTSHYPELAGKFEGAIAALRDVETHA